MTEIQADGSGRDEDTTSRTNRFQAVIGLLGLAGLALAVATTVDDVRGKALPGTWSLAVALVFSVVALRFAGSAWGVLFPPDVDRRAMASGLYTSQLTKYLPAGGVLQVVSQVTLAGQRSSLAAAALRLPVFSMCNVCAGATLGSLLALNDALPLWGRVLAGLGLVTPLVLDRRILSVALGLARKLIHRLPSADELPAQRPILWCYLYSLGTLAAYAATFTVLLADVTEVRPLISGAALCIAWVIGYLIVPLPSGIGVREAVLIASLPGLGTGPLLVASLAHRLLGIVAEAGLAGTSVALLRRRGTPTQRTSEMP